MNGRILIPGKPVPASDISDYTIARDTLDELFSDAFRQRLQRLNAIVRADAKPDWTLDPSAVLGPSRAVEGGDLARMLGVGAEVTEADQALTLAGGSWTTRAEGR